VRRQACAHAQGWYAAFTLTCAVLTWRSGVLDRGTRPTAMRCRSVQWRQHGKLPRRCSEAAAGSGTGSLSSRSEFTITRTLEPAMIAAARTGCRSPSAARATALRL